ncbi:hypothetical protein TNCV_3005241 [Trichonephila clavipes]|nr:hypothetical protein TNCV_3005241 [Trichonephila clavipes]
MPLLLSCPSLREGKKESCQSLKHIELLDVRLLLAVALITIQVATIEVRMIHLVSFDFQGFSLALEGLRRNTSNFFRDSSYFTGVGGIWDIKCRSERQAGLSTSVCPEAASSYCNEDYTNVGRVIVYRASTPQVWGSIIWLGKVDSAFHPRYIGSKNEYQACLGS